MRIRSLVLLLLCLQSPALFGEIPLISRTSTLADPVFRQQQKDTEAWYYNQARNLPPPPLTIYQYQPTEKDNLIQLAALFNLTIDTIATLNNLQNINEFDTEIPLMIPSNPGLFINQQEESSWISRLNSELEEYPFTEIQLNTGGSALSFHYYPGLYLPDEMRLRFIKQMFNPPLDKMVITSPYGYRDHPFTGKWELHVGTDYRASQGSSVKSCADGNILSTGELEDYGKFIIIQHRNGYTSLYGHLDAILVKKGQSIVEGEFIGESGNTGLSTGPHLHFEIRKDGLPQDPENLLVKSGRK